MTNILTRKLELFGPLPDDDRKLLDQIIGQPRVIESRRDVIREGDSPDDVHLVLSGFAYRYKDLPEGNRQIFAYLLPGDFCDLHVFILKAMDHTIATLSRCQMVDIPRRHVLELLNRPAIARALWWVTLVDEATLREWVVNLGARDAFTRLAHLFCEVHLRLKSVGLADGGEFEFPVNQRELGETLGISAVHVSRTLQEFRTRELLAVRNGHIVLRDLRKLRQISGFDPNYLHLEAGKRDD